MTAGRQRTATLLAWLVALGSALPDPAQATSPEQYPARWEVPPGDPGELETAGFAKLLCPVFFITGYSSTSADDPWRHAGARLR